MLTFIILHVTTISTPMSTYQLYEAVLSAYHDVDELCLWGGLGQTTDSCSGDSVWLLIITYSDVEQSNISGGAVIHGKTTETEVCEGGLRKYLILTSIDCNSSL